MICFPNCKINIGLHVHKKRPDGFHNIETMLYPVPLSDILEIVPGAKFSFSQSGLPLNIPADNNLVVKAYHMMKKHFHIPPCRIHLHKVIPPQSGLGGGSSDAAFTLTLLDQLFELESDLATLEQMASELGSDCPFFIRNRPALATGKGDSLADPDTSLQGLFLCLAVPPFGVNTSEAYSRIRPRTQKQDLLKIIRQPKNKWRDILKNDFEAEVFIMHPGLKEIREMLYGKGALYASLSGSGSAMYGLFHTKPDLRFPPDYKTWCLTLNNTPVK